MHTAAFSWKEKRCLRRNESYQRPAWMADQERQTDLILTANGRVQHQQFGGWGNCRSLEHRGKNGVPLRERRRRIGNDRNTGSGKFGSGDANESGWPAYCAAGRGSVAPPFASYCGDPAQYTPLPEGRMIDGASSFGGFVQLHIEQTRLVVSDAPTFAFMAPGRSIRPSISYIWSWMMDAASYAPSRCMEGYGFSRKGA